MRPDLTTLTRKPDRGSSSRDRLDALLDDELVGTLATVVDGDPWAVPLLFARDDDRLLLHGSTGAGALRHVTRRCRVDLRVLGQLPLRRPARARPQPA